MDKVEMFARRIVSLISEGNTKETFEADVVDVAVILREFAQPNAAWTSSPSQAGNNAEGEKSTTMSDEKNVEVLFERVTEFYTDDIVRIDAEYFFRHLNGGYNGAWEAQNFHSKCQLIDRTEARRLALEWGENLETVAETLS